MTWNRRNIVLICLAALAAVSVFARRYFSGNHHSSASGIIKSEKEIVIHAKVTGFGANPEGSIDKMTFAGAGDITEVHFPPHTAKAVLGCVRGDSVVMLTVAQRKPHGPMPAPGYELVTVSQGADTVRVAGLRPPPPAPGGESEVSGNAVSIIRTKEGETAAFILGTTLVALPPPARKSLTPLLEHFKTITVKGFSRDRNSGFVNKYARNVLQPTAIIIDGVSYLVR